MMTSFLYLYLSKFIGAEIHQREVAGVEMDCISIPLEPNSFMRGRYGGVTARFALSTTGAKQKNQQRIIALPADKRKWEEWKRLGYARTMHSLGDAYQISQESGADWGVFDDEFFDL